MRFKITFTTSISYLFIAWGEWRRVSDCSRSCGGGHLLLKRSCIRGICLTGKATFYVSCNTKKCPGKLPFFIAILADL